MAAFVINLKAAKGGMRADSKTLASSRAALALKPCNFGVDHCRPHWSSSSHRLRASLAPASGPQPQHWSSGPHPPLWPPPGLPADHTGLGRPTGWDVGAQPPPSSRWGCRSGAAQPRGGRHVVQPQAHGSDAALGGAARSLAALSGRPRSSGCSGGGGNTHLPPRNRALCAAGSTCAGQGGMPPASLRAAMPPPARRGAATAGAAPGAGARSTN